ncbi:Uncharacterized protein HZ326_29438 [Fusarium oxysporum f. sp. albedinis]|nr:Uncharacterized protein HZ326_29438 [Fusarium oxysporum f. sp. albedinis]
MPCRAWDCAAIVAEVYAGKSIRQVAASYSTDPGCYDPSGYVTCTLQNSPPQQPTKTGLIKAGPMAL